MPAIPVQVVSIGPAIPLQVMSFLLLADRRLKMRAQLVSIREPVVHLLVRLTNFVQSVSMILV